MEGQLVRATQRYFRFHIPPIEIYNEFIQKVKGPTSYV